MQFANPVFLFGLLAVLVPIIIHLFNFRRYRTFYFSNVKMLQDVMQKTRRESQLQHLIVLALRILGIAALALAFARPYIPHADSQNKQGNLVTLFVDNSFSMDANSKDANLLQDAILAAKNIVNAFSYSDDFVLITQDFSAKQSHLLNKEEVLSLLDEMEISPNSHTLDEVLAFENNACSRSIKQNIFHYYISDFQKCNFDFADLQHDKKGRTFVIPVLSKPTNNVAVDSCWFQAPVLKRGQQVTLQARIRNYGNSEVVKLPVKLHINDKQTSMAVVDLQPGSSTELQMNYTIDQSGYQRAVLSIDDSPITYDDKLYFAYNVTPSTGIAVIYEKSPNKYLRALYGKDSLFSYTEMNVKQMNYAKLADCQLVVLDAVTSISSGLADELKQFVTRGGSLLCLPNENADLKSWQPFLSALGCDYYTAIVTATVKVGKINYESRYFKGSLESTAGAIEKPTVLKDLEQTHRQPAEMIMQLENGSPLLSAYRAEQGSVFLSAVPFDDAYGEVHKHALSFIPFHNIGIMSQMQDQLFLTIGDDNQYTLGQTVQRGEDVLTVKALKTGEELIPEQRNTGNATILFFRSQVSEPGFYEVSLSGATLGVLAFNYNRKESDLDYYNEDELSKLSKQGETFEMMNADEKNLTGQIAEQLNGTPLWRYFVIAALLCFLAEILLLRFWGRAKMEETTSKSA